MLMPVLSGQVRAWLQSLREARRAGLDGAEIDALAYTPDGVSASRLVLFGSRAEPRRRGGNLDVLTVTNARAFDISKPVSNRIFSRCEEKIDVIVLPERTPTAEQHAFVESTETVEVA
jgi:hypothetical protein